MPQDELHHRRGVIKAVGMMADAGFVYDLNLAAERLVTRLDNGGVLGGRHSIVGVSDDVNERDLRLRERLQTVDRILRKGERRRLVLESIKLDQRSPIARASFA